MTEFSLPELMEILQILLNHYHHKEMAPYVNADLMCKLVKMIEEKTDIETNKIHGSNGMFKRGGK